MSDTKKSILLSALGLFARDGYEAVPVSAIAAKQRLHPLGAAVCLWLFHDPRGQQRLSPGHHKPQLVVGYPQGHP